MGREGFRALGFVVLAALLATGVMALLPGLLDSAGGSDAELAAALKATEPEGLLVTVSGFAEPLRSIHHGFSRVSLSPTKGRDEAEVAGTLDLTGKLGDVEVSSVGVERIPFHRDGRSWSPTRGWAPNLAAVLQALEARRRALETGDRQALTRLVRPLDRTQAMGDPALEELLQVKSRRYQVRHWYLRLERDEVVVTEQARLFGDLPQRPVDDRRDRRLRLIRDGREFFFSPTLM